MMASHNIIALALVTETSHEDVANSCDYFANLSMQDTVAINTEWEFEFKK